METPIISADALSRNRRCDHVSVSILECTAGMIDSPAPGKPEPDTKWQIARHIKKQQDTDYLERYWAAVRAGQGSATGVNVCTRY